MQAVILAGGYGIRLRPLTYNIPKPMVEISGKPFLEYLITYLKNYGLKDILICTGYMSEKISSYFGDGSSFNVAIKYSDEGAPIGTGGALKNAEIFLNEEFILINGDTFMPLDYGRLIAYYNATGKNIIVVNKNKESQGNIMVNEEEIVTCYSKNGKKLQFNDCGIQLFKKEILRLIPKNKKVSLEKEIFPKLIGKKELLALETDAEFFDLGTFEGIDKFKFVIPQYFNS